MDDEHDTDDRPLTESQKQKIALFEQGLHDVPFEILKAERDRLKNVLEDPRKTADLRNTDRNIPYSKTFEQKNYPLYEPNLWLFVLCVGVPAACLVFAIIFAIIPMRYYG